MHTPYKVHDYLLQDLETAAIMKNVQSAFLLSPFYLLSEVAVYCLSQW